MQEISTKTILMLLGVALIITLVSTTLSISKITGWDLQNSLTAAATAEENATTDVTILSTVGVSVTDTAIDFGSGYYDPTCSTGYATLYSNETNQVCWLNSTGVIHENITDYHTIVNNGTVNINLSMSSNVSHAEEFLCDGGSCALFAASVQVYAFESEEFSCDGALTDSNTTLLNDAESFELDLCTSMGYQDDGDEINVSFELHVPSDAGAGSKSMTVTYLGTE